MEKAPSFVVNAGIRMPIGYRFYPTDEELVVHYLTRKNLALPLPASVIPELDVFQTAPWTLPGDVNEKRYFFSIGFHVNDNKRKRVASGSGCWKPIGKKQKLISASGSNHPVGVKKTLVFCQGKKQSVGANDTRWIMHQYSLLNSSQVNESLGKWFVYRIFQKKRKAKKNGPSFIDFTVDEDECSGFGPPQPSSPSSSEKN